MPRSDLVRALVLSVGTTRMSPEGTDAINDRAKPRENSLEVIIFQLLRRQFEVLGDHYPKRLDGLI